MKKWIKKCYSNAVLRYVFFGGCTTMVNMVSFFVLRKMGIPLHPANFVSIILAILFAYVVNSVFVFQDKCETIQAHIRTFLKFISVRGLTMVIELAGVWLTVTVIGMNDLIGKFVTQFIVLVLNYIFSKFYVFTAGREEKKHEHK